MEQITKIPSKRRAKWARPWFPGWGKGNDFCVAILSRSDATAHILPDIDTPQFWAIIPSDIRACFRIVHNYAGSCVYVPWAQRNQVMRIYGALVTIGYFIMTQTRLSINISPGDLSVALHMLDVAEPVEVLTSEILECLAINHKRRTLKAFEPFLGSPDWDFDPVYVWLKESAWISDRGKEFIRELRTKYPKAASDADRSDSEEEWIVEQEVTVEHSEIEGDHLVPPKAKRAKLSDESVGDDLVAKGAHPLPTVQPSSSHLHNGDDDDDEGLCMICLDKIADTIVHPCLHCVVCSACSIKLRDSADSRKCVRCRCDIEFIDE